MKRTNTWQDVAATGRASIDLGDGIVLPIPTDAAGAQDVATAKAEAITAANDWTKGNAQAYAAALGATNLDTVLQTGIRSQTVSSNVTTANGYPSGEFRGMLVTFKDPGQGIFIVQQYLGGFTKKVWQREYYGGAWSAWTLIGPVPAYNDAALAARVEALEEGSTSGVQKERTVQVVGDYRPDAWATPEGTVSYWTGPSGTERIGWDYKGGGYVGKLAAHTGYTTMQIKKVQSNDEVEVSCLNPVAGTHVTHRIQGKGPLAGQDDQRRFEEAWVGTYTGTTVSKDLLAMPRSNAEWAFQIDVGGNNQFAPYHGSTSTYAVEYGPATITDGNGDPLNLTGMAVNQVMTGVQGFKVRQRLYLSHPAEPGVKSAAVDEVHTITPDGMIQAEAVVTFLKDVKIGSNYAPMTPVDQPTFGNMKVWGGSTYTIKTTAPATTEYLTVTEGHATQSAYFWSGTNTSAFVAVNYLDRPASFAVGHPLEDTTTTAMRIEQRSTSGFTKLYPQPFLPGSTIPAGTVWRPGAQWRVGQAANAGQYA